MDQRKLGVLVAIALAGSAVGFGCWRYDDWAYRYHSFTQTESFTPPSSSYDAQLNKRWPWLPGAATITVELTEPEFRVLKQRYCQKHAPGFGTGDLFGGSTTYFCD